MVSVANEFLKSTDPVSEPDVPILYDENDGNVWVPLVNLKTKHYYPHKSDQRPGPSSEFYSRFPAVAGPSSRSIPMPCTEPGDLEDENDSPEVPEMSGAYVGKRRVFLDKVTTAYLVYTTVIQPTLKCLLALSLMSQDLKLDNACREVKCETPVYNLERIVYYLDCLVILSLSVIHYSVGVVIFTKIKRVLLYRIKGPMKCFAATVLVEMIVLGISVAVLHFTFDLMMFAAVVVSTESFAVLIVFCYPEKSYVSLENETCEPTQKDVQNENANFPEDAV